MGRYRVQEPAVLRNDDGAAGKLLDRLFQGAQRVDIQIICANTPQAKGRIERANQTL
jgi:hypothetical protein